MIQYSTMFRLFSRFSATVAALAVFPYSASAGPVSGFLQSNLVSDIPGFAAVTDSRLRNPWGIAFSGTSPFWISDNAAGLSTLYNGAGTAQALVVTIPGAGGAAGAPTGVVFNTTTKFNADLFLFAGEDGLLTGWRGALGTTAEVLADNSGANAVYKGLTLDNVGSNSYLLAADFHNDDITILPSSGAPALSGHFLDPTLPSGFAPFNIQTIQGKIYVTYARQDAAKHDDVAGPGNGYVNVFDQNGNLLQRLISGGPLNSPWGLAVAPASFGSLGGDLLVGNFGDGTIHAFDIATGALAGTLLDANGQALVNEGLWALTVGNGGNGGSPQSVYLTAGLNGETDGLFARIDPVPEPGTWVLLLGAGAAVLYWRPRRF